MGGGTPSRWARFARDSHHKTLQFSLSAGEMKRLETRRWLTSSLSGALCSHRSRISFKERSFEHFHSFTTLTAVVNGHRGAVWTQDWLRDKFNTNWTEVTLFTFMIFVIDFRHLHLESFRDDGRVADIFSSVWLLWNGGSVPLNQASKSTILSPKWLNIKVKGASEAHPWTLECRTLNRRPSGLFENNKRKP